MSPAEFLLSRSHTVGRALLPSDVKHMWREGHPNFGPFRVGQLVLAKNNKRGFLNENKLSANFDGPLEVIVVNDNCVTYQVKHVETGIISRAHHSKLRPFSPPPNYIRDHPYFPKYYSGSLSGPTLGGHESPDGPLPPAVGCSRVFPVSDRETSDSSSEVSSGESDDKSVLAGTERESSLPPSLPPKNASLCRGCEFESKRDLLLSRSWPTLNSVLVDLGIFDLESSPVTTSHTGNMVDWTDTESGTFELPSIESQSMIDESKDDSCHSESGNIQLPAINAQAMQMCSSETCPNETENNFGGFETRDTLYCPSARLVELLKYKTNNYRITPDVGQRKLRSRGPVEDLPFVQPVTLERKRYTRKRTSESE